MVTAWRRAGQALVRATEAAGVLLVVGLIGLLVVNIAVRELFGIPLVWANEVSLVLFTWTVFLGAAVAFSRNGRIRFDVLQQHLPPPLRRGLDRMARWLGIGGLAALLVIGLRLVALNWDHRMTSLDASAAWQWACLPAGAAIAIVGWLSGPEGDPRAQETD